MSTPPSASGERFREHYAHGKLELLPWFHPEPDADLVALFDRALDAPARVLDLGAGPAVHSIHLAMQGHQVVALDAIDQAREMALALAADRGATIEYLVGDALELGHLPAFDAILDRGFLHTLEPEHRPAWRHAVYGALVPRGHLFLKCFDVRPADRGFGPPGLSAADVLELLGDPDRDGLELVSLERTRFAGHDDDPRPHAAWTVWARRP